MPGTGPNDPGKATYRLVRVGALIPIAALVATTVLVLGTGKRDQPVIHGVLLTEVWPVPVVGYRQNGRQLAVVLRTDSQPCHAEVVVLDESVTEVEIDARLVESKIPWSTPCSARSKTTTVHLVLEHPLGERMVVTRAPRVGAPREDRWDGPLHVVPKT